MYDCMKSYLKYNPTNFIKNINGLTKIAVTYESKIKKIQRTHL